MGICRVCVYVGSGVWRDGDWVGGRGWGNGGGDKGSGGDGMGDEDGGMDLCVCVCVCVWFFFLRGGGGGGLEANACRLETPNIIMHLGGWRNSWISFLHHVTVYILHAINTIYISFWQKKQINIKYSFLHTTLPCSPFEQDVKITALTRSALSTPSIWWFMSASTFSLAHSHVLLAGCSALL